MVESKEEIKSLLMRVKEDSEKAGLKLNIKKKLRSWHPVPSLHGKYGRKVETMKDFIFLGSKITVDSDCSDGMKRCFLLEWKAMVNLDSVLKIRDITLMMKVSIVIWMWELDYKECWLPNNWWFVVLEKTLGSSLDCKEIKPVNPKGDQTWIFIGRTDAESQAPIFGHLMQRANSLGKTLMLGKTEGKRRRVGRG